MESMGRHFDMIRGTQADAARCAAAMVAEREFVTELACTLRLPVRPAKTLIAETRTLTHRETGVVLSDGRDRYQVPKDQRRYLRVRNETCRWPGCRRAAAHSDLDHTLDWQFDRLTALRDLAHLCPADHTLKTETRWRYAHLPDGTIQWTSPSGRTFISEPATILRMPGKRAESMPTVRRAAMNEPAPF